ncbi:hypothetical protein HZS_7434 [Henneguya salminicola]|nr:hypothetical protein HZS_7434 [Henneguya salminicola]
MFGKYCYTNGSKRVMSDCFLLLQRFFLKVDGVILRCYETRIYHEFETAYLTRSFLKKERFTTDIVKYQSTYKFVY